MEYVDEVLPPEKVDEVHGLGASRGVAEGQARHVASLDDFDQVREGLEMARRVAARRDHATRLVAEPVLGQVRTYSVRGLAADHR